MKSVYTILRRFLRTLTIVFLVAVGSTVLVRVAPGYLSDAREMDARYAGVARAELTTQATQSKSIPRMVFREVRGWVRGDLGTSRQYDVPVEELIAPRLAVTGGMILRSILAGWLLAMTMALVSSAGRSPSLFWQVPATVLLAAPTAALATTCLLADHGGPVLVMTLLIAARDFKFLHHMLSKAWREEHLLQARAQGVTTLRLIGAHILPGITSQLLALCSLSIVTALGALVPVEVIFSVPGVGQLAWTAALNRDLPVLLAVTMIMAIAISCAGMISDSSNDWQTT